jgi:hypothetical protein
MRRPWRTSVVTSACSQACWLRRAKPHQGSGMPQRPPFRGPCQVVTSLHTEQAWLSTDRTHLALQFCLAETGCSARSTQTIVCGHQLGHVGLSLAASVQIFPPMARPGCHQPPGRTGTDSGGPLGCGRTRTCLPPAADPLVRRLGPQRPPPAGCPPARPRRAGCRRRRGRRDHGPAVRWPGPARPRPAGWPRRTGRRGLSMSEVTCTDA